MRHRCELTVLSLGIGIPANKVERLTFDVHGILEDIKHYGTTRIANARLRKEAPTVPSGKVEENWRMFSAISIEDFLVIKNQYEREYHRVLDGFTEKYLGANIVVKGVDNFSLCPIGSVLDFYGEGPTLCICSENTSCKTPGILIAQDFNLPKDEAKKFVHFANGHRGVVGKVLKKGLLVPGMEGILYEPGF
jgi:hypothetical protein